MTRMQRRALTPLALQGQGAWIATAMAFSGVLVWKKRAIQIKNLNAWVSMLTPTQSNASDVVIPLPLIRELAQKQRSDCWTVVLPENFWWLTLVFLYEVSEAPPEMPLVLSSKVPKSLDVWRVDGSTSHGKVHKQ